MHVMHSTQPLNTALPSSLDHGHGELQALNFHPEMLSMWDFPKIRVPYCGVLIIRILLFRVLY